MLFTSPSRILWLLALAVPFVGGCGHTEVETDYWIPTPRAKVQPRYVPAPKAVGEKHSGTEQYFIDRKYDRTRLTCSTDRMTHGSVSVQVTPIDSVSCPTHPSLTLDVAVAGGRVVPVCAIPAFDNSLLLFHVAIENRSQHLLYLERTPFLLVDSKQVLATPELAAGAIARSWSSRLIFADIAAPADAESQEARHGEEFDRSSLNLDGVFANFTDLSRTGYFMPPGLSLDGYLAFPIPSDWRRDHAPHTFNLGFYDVPVARDQAGTPVSRKAFQFECVARIESVDLRIAQTRNVTWTEAPASPAAASRSAANGQGNETNEWTCLLGDYALLTKCAPSLRSWINHVVRVDLSDGREITGRLEGIDVVDALIATSIGTIKLPLLEAKRIQAFQ